MLISLSLPRLAATLLFAAVLTGCASDQIRGKLNYDLRPQGERTEVVWPQPPDEPRYRYVGELVGEPNFERVENSGQMLQNALHWIVGLFEVDKQQLLQRPQYGVVSESGRIYVVDTGRNAVMVFDPNPPADDKDKKSGGQLLIWDALNAAMRFESPVAVALAWNGDVVVSDVAYGAVLRINEKGELLGMIGAGQMKRPTGLAFDGETGLLYVADTVAHNIKVFDESGMLVDIVGSPGDGAGEFNAPTHLSFAGGHLYVSDTLNNRIQVFGREGKHMRSFGEQGLYIGNLTRPKGVAVDDAGIVYVVESYFRHLLAYNAKGELLLGMNGSGLPQGEFLLPAGVWTDKRGQIYVADMFNGRVVVFKFLGNTKE